MADGLALAAGAANVAVVVNTGDDFEHLGLSISPDVDSVCYALADLENTVLGWGRRDETWGCMETLGRLGGETWFRLGDKDLAIHIERTRLRADGLGLSAVTAHIARRLGIGCRVLPMSDSAVRTLLDTDEGTLEFQHYFVRRRCEPQVRAIRFEGAGRAPALPEALAALDDAGLAVIVVGPSNPYISIAPILAVDGYRARLERRRVPVVAVSPVVGGRALKGPTVKMMGELGLDPSALTIARHYRGLIDGLVIDHADRALAGAIESEGIAVHVCDAIMGDRAGRQRLAEEVLRFGERLAVRT